MVVCADTSFLFALYGNDVHTPRAVKWVKSHSVVLTLTVLNEYELENALRFAEFRKAISVGDATLFLAQFEADRAAGRLVLQVCNLADVLGEARRLSATHTIRGGHRAFDVLHIAAALKLKGREFLTFDDNQKKLAITEGLRVSV